MNPIPNHCIECDKPTVNILCNKCKEKDMEKPIKEDPMSNCCSAAFTYPGYPESDICSKCKEHASIWEEDTEEEYSVTIIGTWGVMAESQEDANRYILDQFYSGNSSYTSDVEVVEEEVK